MNMRNIHVITVRSVPDKRISDEVCMLFFVTYAVQDSSFCTGEIQS